MFVGRRQDLYSMREAPDNLSCGGEKNEADLSKFVST